MRLLLAKEETPYETRYFTAKVSPDGTVGTVKYSVSGHEIKVSLRQQGKILAFELSNCPDFLPDGNLNKLLERFVRADDSRSRESGGYGLGLSIAKAIAEAYKGSIDVRREVDHWIRFSLSLPGSTI